MMVGKGRRSHLGLESKALMPGTAKEVAGWLGVPYSFEGLLDNPGYNAKLGARYLQSLSQQFDGNPVMMAVSLS